MLQLTVLDLIVSLLDIFFLIALLFIIDFYTQHPSHVVVNSPVRKLFDAQPLLLVGIFSLLFGLKNWFAFLVSKKQFYFVYGVAARISQNKLTDYLDGSYSNYVNIDSSVHFRSIFNNAMEFAQYVLRGTQQVISQAVLILFALIPVIIFKPLLFSLLLLILLPPVFLLSFIMKKKIQLIREAAKTTNSRLIQHLKEAIAGFVESNIYQRRSFFTGRFKKYLFQQVRGVSEQQIIQSFPPRLIEVFAVLGLFFLIAINFFTKGKTIDVLTIGAFMAAAYKIIPGIVKIWNCISQIKTYEFTIPALMENKMVHSRNIIHKEISINTVSFSNVSFAYENKSVLKNFSFDIKAGDFIGLSGKSGIGKTTVINLLLGFLQPDSGFILINQMPQTPDELAGYWEKISYMQQQSFLIHDSILRNIILDENGHDPKRISEVAKITGLSQLTQDSADGLNIPISEEGKNISGGQRQRIALARALYKNADLIILDEPFNELDKESENCVMSYLKSLTGSGKMILLITHDKETLLSCSKIISLDEK